jgi:uncharacterized membrane protein YhhN
MDPVSGAAFAGAAVFAGGDWLAVARRGTSARWQRVEYVCKPATLAALVVAAAALDPAAGADTRQRWFVAALVFSLVGDVLLMLPSEQFLGGLLAFLVGHLCYIAGFWTDAPTAIAFLASAALAAVAIGTVARRILPAVRSTDPPLTGPVAGYMVVIGVMVASALATGNLVAAAGAALFAASDSLIAWNRFVGALPAAGLAIMVTYHLGQALLVLSLLH